MRNLWQRLTRSARPDPKKVSSMLTVHEIDHLRSCALERYTGEGAIVDLGTWLGGSTAALCDGLTANAAAMAKGQKVHAYDLFRMNAYMKKTYRLPEIADIPEGGSFLDVFERNLAPWSKVLVTHAGDFSQMDWTHGPVELVHVDIMKNWALTNATLRMFFRELIPGRSIVLHQDFVHFNTVWIHLVMYRLRDHFEATLHVPGSTTVEFRLRKAMPTELLDHTYDFKDFDAGERKAAFAWSRGIISDEFMRFNIDAAEAMTPLHMGDRPTASALLEEALLREADYKRAHPEERRRSELAQVKLRLETVAG